MPRMDGLQALIQIKGDPDICDIPVIVFTASETETDIIACYRAQAAAFIRKPLTVDGLVVLLPFFPDACLLIILFDATE